MPSNSTFTVPVGPCLCFPNIISANPFTSFIFDCHSACSIDPNLGCFLSNNKLPYKQTLLHLHLAQLIQILLNLLIEVVYHLFVLQLLIIAIKPKQELKFFCKSFKTLSYFRNFLNTTITFI